MNLEAIYFISQVVAAAAVVGSLVFVGIQIRQSNRFARAQGNAARAQGIGEFQWRMTEPEFATLFRKGGALSAPMTDVERDRYLFTVVRLVQGFEEFHEAHASGMLGDTQWKQTFNAYTGFMRQPGFRIGYRLYRTTKETSPAITVLDELLEKAEGTEPVDLSVVWTALAERELEFIRKAQAAQSDLDELLEQTGEID